jgi:hypothetical protein
LQSQASERIQEATLKEHANHVQFFNDLYATLVDPVAEGQIKEADLMKALLESASWYRQHVYDLENQTAKLQAEIAELKVKLADLEEVDDKPVVWLAFCRKAMYEASSAMMMVICLISRQG